MTIYVPYSKIVIADLSYVQPVVATSYLQINVVAEVTMPDVLSVDVITPADDLVLAFSKKLVDTSVLSDLADKTLSKPAADTATMADAVAHKSLGKKLSDEQGTTDTVLYSFNKSLFDSAAPTDSMAHQFGKSLTDVYSGFVDQQTIVVGKVLADSFSMTDMIDIEYWLDKQLSDSQLVVEQFTYTFAKSGIADAFAAADAFKQSFSKALADVYSGFLDTQTFSVTKGLSENLTMEDMVDIQYWVDKSLADAQAIAEQFTFAISKSDISDSAAVNDAFVQLVGKALADVYSGFQEALVFGVDKALADVYSGFQEALAFATTKLFTDSVNTPTDQIALAPNKALTDATASFSDSSIYSLEKVFQDIVTLTDFADAYRVYIREYFEDLTVPDVYKSEFTSPETESATVNDAYLYTYNKNTAETLNLVDNMDGDIEYAFVKVVGELVTSSDSNFLAFTGNKSDNVISSDSGYLKIQDYCDLTYFLEDYVGISRTF